MLQPTQVSLKKEITHNSDKKQTKSKLSNNTAPGTARTDDDEAAHSYRVHKYLAFALVLPPPHAFSQTLLDALAVVAPLFPTVSVYVGMCVCDCE